MLKGGDAREVPRASERGFGEALEQPVSHTRSGRVDLWSALGEQVDLTPKKPRYLDLWSTLRERLDLTKKKPRRVDGIEVVCQASAHGESIYVLKSPLRSSYLKLDARDYFLFEQMDGVHTVRDLALAYFLQFQAFPFDRLLALLAQLKVECFLVMLQMFCCWMLLRLRLELKHSVEL